MAERKPASLSWQGFAEQQIQAAQEAGEFEHLAGLGAPIPGIDQPLEENWWVSRKLKSEQLSVLPPLLEARRDIEQTRARVSGVGDEVTARRAFEELKDRVWKAITSPAPSPPVVVLPIDVEAELVRWRSERKTTSDRAP